jgi:uncharacterized protein with NRDE domain
MCILFISLLQGLDARYKIVILNNRDEFWERPTAVAAFWDDVDPKILAGTSFYPSERETHFATLSQGLARRRFVFKCFKIAHYVCWRWLGRDLVRGGTWFGITRSGRFACLTNYRVPKHMILSDKKSRGELPSEFLKYVMNALCRILDPGDCLLLY